MAAENQTKRLASEKPQLSARTSSLRPCRAKVACPGATCLPSGGHPFRHGSRMRPPVKPRLEAALGHRRGPRIDRIVGHACQSTRQRRVRLKEPRASWMSKVANQGRFFHRFGKRVREMRQERGYSQEDMISFGFSARHWQQVEAGRSITVATLLRICGVFETSVERLVRGLDRGIYED